MVTESINSLFIYALKTLLLNLKQNHKKIIKSCTTPAFINTFLVKQRVLPRRHVMIQDFKQHNMMKITFQKYPCVSNKSHKCY